MRPRSLPFLCLCLVLAGLAAASFRLRPSPFPVGDEATHVLMARSLWEDHDLAFDKRDLQAGYRIWNGGPAGVALLTRDAGQSLRYAEPIAWALAAAPVQALLGPSGLPVLNMALFLAMLAAAAWRYREQGEQAGGLFLAGFFFASAAFGYVFRGSPEVFLMACVFFGVLLWKRTAGTARTGRTTDLGEFRALALAGALFAAAALHEPALALLGLAAAVDLLLGGKWKGAAVLVLAGAMVFGVLAAGQRKLTGAWSPANPREGIQRRTFEDEFPIESQGDLWQAYGKSRPAPDLAAGLRLLPRNLGYFVAGRNTGLLAYFPFGLLALGLMVRDRSRWLLLSAVGAAVLIGLLIEPHRWHGGPGALGNGHFAVLYPVLLFLPGRLAVRRSLVLPFVAAALWTLPALVPGALSAGSADLPAFRPLPLELTLLGDGVQLPGYRVRGWEETVWVLPLATSWPDEGHPNGAWLKGASTSEVVVVSPEPLERIRFNVHSLTDDNELLVDSGAERVLVRFDSEGKRNGAPVDLAVKQTASGLGILPGAAEEHVYRFTLAVSGGIIPARRLPGSRDPRYLGVFLDVTGKGL
jgi:hypothetical protein